MILKLCVFLFFSSSQALVGQSNYTLEQVFIFSRHNARTPLKATSFWEMVSDKPWPKFNESEDLTQRGAFLEGRMGEYFKQWFNQQNLLSEECPTENELYVYAHLVDRTIATAKAFVSKAFPNCSVTVHYKEDDPLFEAEVRNSTAVFSKLVKESMVETLDRLNLNETYEYLERLLDFEHSSFCKDKGICKLNMISTKVSPVKVGHRPHVESPLNVADGVVDIFLMQYYNGFPAEDVAWGQIKGPKEWRQILKAPKAFDNVIFNPMILARDLGKPNMKYIADAFKDKLQRITLVVGHDSNIHTIINSLRSKPYELPNQYENVPIGGKLVFQKWYESSKKKYWLRLDYVYQSAEQLRNGDELSQDSPPQTYLLELDDCIADNEGFCPWEDFMQILNDINPV